MSSDSSMSYSKEMEMLTLSLKMVKEVLMEKEGFRSLFGKHYAEYENHVLYGKEYGGREDIPDGKELTIYIPYYSEIALPDKEDKNKACVWIAFNLLIDTSIALGYAPLRRTDNGWKGLLDEVRFRMDGDTFKACSADSKH